MITKIFLSKMWSYFKITKAVAKKSISRGVKITSVPSVEIVNLNRVFFQRKDINKMIFDASFWLTLPKIWLTFFT